MKGYCAEIHRLFSGLERYHFPFDEDEIPEDGIYVLFEKGEKGHGTDRIVRIGTHRGRHLLASRLYEHFVVENKDRSIFRKHVGRALLKKDGDPFFLQWNWDLTSRADRNKYGPKLDRKKQLETERRVTRYIQDKLSFVVLRVSNKQTRLDLEGRLIGEVSSCEECQPSTSWLGQHAPYEKIRQSGLWQIQKVYGKGLSAADMEKLREVVKVK